MRLRERIDSLREVLTRSGLPDGLDNLPQQLETIFQRLDSTDVHPVYRADIYELLGEAVGLAYLLTLNTYETKTGAVHASRLHEVVARINTHLVNRPTNQAFGILFPRTNTLHSDIFATSGEADNKLAELAHIGLREHGEVVEVSIISGKVSQPKAPQIDLPDNVLDLTAQIEKEMK